MRKSDPVILYDSPEHKFIFLGMEENDVEGIFTNQFLIVHKNEGVLLDPGGVHVFPRVLANVSEFINPKDIKHIFYTHQDPDVSSGIALWSAATPAKFYISALWQRFLPHFGVFDFNRLKAIKDNGDFLSFSDGSKLEFIPAHFVHSPGNFNLYDPASKILFSGDVGVGVKSASERTVFVDGFDKYVKYVEGFHKRYMASNKACKKYCEIVSRYDINIMAPQHGSLYNKEDYQKFIQWFKNLNCGVDIIDEIYGK